MSKYDTTYPMFLSLFSGKGKRAYSVGSVRQMYRSSTGLTNYSQSQWQCPWKICRRGCRTNI